MIASHNNLNDESESSVALSVVIPVYNGELFISDCLESVRIACERFTAEMNGATEIICVDDGSQDNSVEVIKSQNAETLLLENENNQGFAPTCNRGLEAARGEYLFLLNQDTRTRPDALLILFRKLNSDPGFGIVGPKFIGFNGRLQFECRSLPTYENVFYELCGLACLFPQSQRLASWRMRYFDHRSEAFVEQPMGAAMLFRRSLLEKVGGLDESFPIFFNDVDWARRIQSAGYVNLYCPAATVEHFVGSATRSQKPKMILESHRSLYHYFEKWRRNDSPREKALRLIWRALLTVTGRLRALYWKLRD